jgi:hypothetical protein
MNATRTGTLIVTKSRRSFTQGSPTAAGLVVFQQPEMELYQRLVEAARNRLADRDGLMNADFEVTERRLLPLPINNRQSSIHPKLPATPSTPHPPALPDRACP